MVLFCENYILDYHFKLCRYMVFTEYKPLRENT